MSSGILVSIVFAACAAGAACTSNSTPAAATPASQAVVAADAAWTAALAGRDGSAASALDAEFEWTNSQGRTYTRGETLQHMRESFGDKVFMTVIRRSVRYPESAERGVSILDYRPELGADYLALGEEFLRRVGMDEESGRVAELRAELVPA